MYHQEPWQSLGHFIEEYNATRKKAKMCSAVAEQLMSKSICGPGQPGHDALRKMLGSKERVPVYINEEIPPDRIVFYEGDDDHTVVWLNVIDQ